MAQAVRGQRGRRVLEFEEHRHQRNRISLAAIYWRYTLSLVLVKFT